MVNARLCNSLKTLPDDRNSGEIKLLRAPMIGSVLHRRSLLVVGAALTLSSCAKWFGGEGSSTNAGRRPANVEPLEFNPEEGLAAINATRKKYLLGAFRRDERLQQAAQNHADYMARTGKFGHEFGPDTKFPTRIFAVGFEGSAGENLGVGYGSIDEAIDGWLNSPKHREILLRRNYDLAGIAYAFNASGQNDRYTHFWVLEVGEEPPPGMPLGPYVRRI